MTIGAKVLTPASARPSRMPEAVGLLAYAVLAIVAVTLAATVPLNGYLLNILMQAATYAVAVFGLTVVLGVCGQINLAQAAFFGIGADAVGLGAVDLHMNFWICLAAGPPAPPPPRAVPRPAPPPPGG